MLVKQTRSLFKGTYQYKIVLVCPAAALVRAGDFAGALSFLTMYNIETNKSWIRIKTKENLEYCINVFEYIRKMQDYEIRVESPLLTIYTNNKKDINKLANIDTNNVKYISEPDKNTVLVSGTVIMPKIDYDFKVTLGRTRQEQTAFLEWAEQSNKVKLTKSCSRDLNKAASWGGTHFYVTGDNTLLVVKMHLGGAINKVEKIVKQ